MAKILVLTNLKPGVTEVMIRNFLFSHGSVSSIAMNQPRDRQQGYAYVTMESDRDATNVVRQLNNHPLLGQDVSISRTSSPFRQLKKSNKGN